MNKKLLIFILLFMLFSVSFVSAQRICKSDDVLEVLRKALYIYYTDPKSSSFTADELKSLLSFYISIQPSQITVDCTAQSDNIDRANALPDLIPTCSDGTKYGKCSANKPMYCYAGRSVPRCKLCGCPIGQWCNITYTYTEKGNKGQWGKCYSGTNITCTIDGDCGLSGYTGNYSCINEDVYRKYHKYECFNPGASNATCFNYTQNVLIDDCNATEQCIEGQAGCQIVEQPSGCGIVQQLTTGGLYNYLSDVYEDKIVWSDDRNGNYDVYMYDLATGQETRITTHTANQHSPFIYGDKIVYRDDRYASGHYYVFMYNLATGQETQITPNPGWYGELKIYENKILWDNRNGLEIYDLTTGQITQTGVSGYYYDIYGDKVVFERNVGGNNDIYMYDLITKQETRITSHESEQTVPKIYGNIIIWEDHRAGSYVEGVWKYNGAIFMYDLTTKQETRITPYMAEAYSPDIYGNIIAWYDWREGIPYVYTYSLFTREETRLAAIPANPQTLLLYGDTIVFDAKGDIDNVWNIYTTTTC